MIVFEYNNGFKKIFVEHEYQITTDAWHLITLAFNCRDTISVLSIYIDEKLLGLHEIDFSDSKPILSSCFIGKSSSNNFSTQFIGSISHFYIWGVSLSHDAVVAIHSLSPMYQGIFYENLEYDFKKCSGIKSKILMGAFSRYIICAFSARHASGNICHDISTNFAASRCEALYSDEVCVVETQKIFNSLRSLGGVNALFSIFEIVCPYSTPKDETFSKIITLFLYFINDLASNSNYFCQCLISAKLHRYISWRLIIAFELFPFEFIECILESSKISLSKNENKKMFKSILLNFLLNDVWWCKYSNSSLQNAIIFMLGEKIHDIDYCFYLKTYIGITPLIKILNSFYTDAQTDDHIIIIKSLLIRLISHMLTQGAGVQTSELNLLIDHFLPIKDHLQDLSTILIQLSSYNKEIFSSAFCASNSILVFNELLASSDFDLMMKGLEIITFVINNAPESAFDHIVNKFDVWSLLIYQLKDKFSHRIYHQLLQIMVGGDFFSNLSTSNISKLQKITIKKPIMMQVISFLIHLGIESSSGIVEVDAINSIASDYIALVKNIVTHDRSSCRAIYAKNGWQAWLVVFLKIMNKHPNFDEINQSVIVIIFCIIKHGLINFDHGWISFVDLLGYFHFVNYDEHFDSILRLINTSSHELDEFIQQTSLTLVDEHFYSTVSKQESDYITLNTKREIYSNINSFNLQDLTMKMLYFIIIGLKSEFLNYSNIHSNHFCSSAIFLKNTANIILLVSDLIINAFGGLNHLLDISCLSNPETHLISPLTHNCNFQLMHNILKAIYSIVESFFTENSFSFKKMEESLDLEPTELLKISLRVFLCNLLIKICVDNFTLWKISYSEPKILNNINIQLKYFFRHESQSLQNSSNIYSPLIMRKLISRQERIVFREIFARKAEYVGDFNSIIETCVYVIGKVMLSQYMRIIEYVPEESDLIFSTFTVSEIVKASLKDIAAVLYEIFVSNSSYFHKILPAVTGESILETGLKIMRSGFDTLEFVMLLTSQRWSEVFIKIFYPKFHKFCHKSKKYSLYAIGQIEKRSCFSLDLYFQSALQIKNSLLEATKASTPNRDNFKSLKRTKDFSKTLRIDFNTFACEVPFFNLKTENSCTLMNIILFGLYRQNESVGYYKLNNIEDSLRRRSNLSLCKYNTIDCKYISKTSVADCFENEEMEFSKIESISSNSSTIISSKDSCRTTNFPFQFNSSKMEILNKSLIFQQIIPHNTPTSMNFVSFVAKRIYCGMCINGNVNVTACNQIVEFCIDQNTLTEFDKNFEYSQIIRIFTRFYAHEANSVEIFLMNGRSYFLCMENYHCVAALVNLLPPTGIGKDYGLPSVRDVSFFSPCNMFEQSSIPKNWSKGLISNFEYLMFLNTISGRSYNDISQYPIFPWVLSNYESDEIDLNDDKNYRDLSKPVCIIKDARCRYFREKYENRSKNIAPYFYQKYCSSPDYVTDYLIRLEPFGLMRVNLDSLGGIAPRQISTRPHFSTQRKAPAPVLDPNKFGKIIYIGFSLKNQHLLFSLVDSNLKCASVDLKFDLNEIGVIDNFNLDDHRIIGILNQYKFIESVCFDSCSNYIPNFNSFSVPESGHHLISACAYIDNSFRLFDMSNGKIIQIVEYHNEKVTCIDADYLIAPDDEYYVVTGSQDASICLWSYSSKNYLISRVKSTENPLKISSICFMYGHTNAISFINIKARFGLILSCSSRGYICLHSLDGTLRSFFSLIQNQSLKIINLRLTYDALIISMCSGCSQSQLDIFQHNGSPILHKKIPQELILMALDLHGKYCGVAGGDKLTVFNSTNLEILCTYTKKMHIISAIRFI
ncbi:hypothetical protein MXB_898, partial [Myxobolus squamalis]